MEPAKVFLLTTTWKDIRGRNVLFLYGSAESSKPVEILINNYRPVFFIEKDSDLKENNFRYLRKSSKLKSFSGKHVDAVYFNTQRELKTAAEKFSSENLRIFESDIDPVRRYLMEKNINVQCIVEGEYKLKESAGIQMLSFINPKIKACEMLPEFKVASIDIETGIKLDSLYSIAVHLTGKIKEEKKVFMIGDSKNKGNDIITYYNSEPEMLNNFIAWFRNCDPDIIIGWHVIGFDLMFLEKKCREFNISFKIGRGDFPVTLRKMKSGRYFADIPGRVVMDGPVFLRSAFYTFDDFRLETVAQELLGEGKTIAETGKVNEIERMFAEDKIKLAEYNLNDAVLVSDIFKKTGLIDLSVKRSQISGLLMEQLGMMTAAFDHFYLPRLHKAGFVAPDVRDIKETSHAAGGYVIDPKPGIYNDVVVLDFKSLYPSIIQTFKIDPLSLLKNDIDTLQTPGGYKFSRTDNILPGFIGKLMQRREDAKKSNDKHLSQAIKILMNSFYGVMGSYGCRFYHHDLPNAITGTGHRLLLGSKEKLEKDGYSVIYGDTDSLFVKLNQTNSREINGEKIAVDLNSYWSEKISKDFGLNSFLELEYEKYYSKFIITPARGGETGAKKRYAGLLVKDGKEILEFVGMEFVRSDWTKLAKEFQVELYQKIFNDEDVTDWIKSIVRKVNEGVFDNKLIYQKRLRKNLEDYVKNIPPQVRAAKMIDRNSGSIQYLITKRGPIPVELKHDDIDYKHYIEKQLKPVADSVLVLLGKSFDSIVDTSNQLSFFD
ncbi:MAG: DNA polymerase II [Ignavibacteriaceae bacterium]